MNTRDNAVDAQPALIDNSALDPAIFSTYAMNPKHCFGTSTLATMLPAAEIQLAEPHGIDVDASLLLKPLQRVNKVHDKLRR